MITHFLPRFKPTTQINTISHPHYHTYFALNPIYVRDAYKQIVDLGKKLGFPPIVKLRYNDKDSPVMFTAEHNGIKRQHLLLPVHRTEEVTPGDIILGEPPSIYGQQDTGKN